MDRHFVTLLNLDAIRQELQQLEPLFHRPEFGTSRESFEHMMDADFWEVGASGRCYSREYVLDALVRRKSAPHEDVWETRDFRCTELGSDTYLMTYTLIQDRVRVTRRATVWRKTPDGWKVMYHQGTIVQVP